MINRKLEDIIIEDLRQLVENNVIEKKTLEYKSQLPGNTDLEKKEFLADVSSFANTLGGDLIVGIKEKDGILVSDIGFKIDDLDTEIARLENIIRDGIMPRPSVDLHTISGEGDKKILIIRIKASLETPHRVIFKGHDKFYRRNSNGKYPMDIDELRIAFLQSSSLIEKIRNFRKSRVLDIKAGETPYPLLSHSSCIVIHILPLSAYNTSYVINSDILLEIKEGKHSDSFSPFYPSGWSHRINLDGVVVYSQINDNVVRTYTQLYRNGIVESVESSILSRQNETENKVLPMYFIEDKTMKYVENILKFLTKLDFQSPFYIFLSLLGIKSFTVSKPENRFFLETEPITIDDLLLPEIIIESVDDNIHHKFRPIFDMIWNAAGVSRSLNFDENNNFKNGS